MSGAVFTKTGKFQHLGRGDGRTLCGREAQDEFEMMRWYLTFGQSLALAAKHLERFKALPPCPRCAAGAVRDTEEPA